MNIFLSFCYCSVKWALIFCDSWLFFFFSEFLCSKWIVCPECAACNSTVCTWRSLQPSSASSTSLLGSFALVTICDGNNTLTRQCRICFCSWTALSCGSLEVSWEFNVFLFLVDLKMTSYLLLALSYDRPFFMCVGLSSSAGITSPMWGN